MSCTLVVLALDDVSALDRLGLQNEITFACASKESYEQCGTMTSSERLTIKAPSMVAMQLCRVVLHCQNNWFAKD